MNKTSIQSYHIARKVRLETQNANPVVSHCSKKYDWKRKTSIQSYRIARKIRLETQNLDPVVPHRPENTTGKPKRRSSPIASPGKYDWKAQTPIQSYRIARKVRLESPNADPVVSHRPESTTGKPKRQSPVVPHCSKSTTGRGPPCSSRTFRCVNEPRFVA